LKTLEGCTVYEGMAVCRRQKVAVGDVKLAANRVFINVGGRALIRRYRASITCAASPNSSIMDLDIVPPHLIIWCRLHRWNSRRFFVVSEAQ